MKYSAIAQPAYGAMYCSGAGSAALAMTIVVYSIAPAALSTSTMLATVDSLEPIATWKHFRPLPFWAMIVSMAMAVLSVLWSPLISSRCLRILGIMLSIAV